jgi:hypothetical protein
MTRTITVEHGGTSYAGQLAKIDSTMLGREDHGILTAFLYCSWHGGGVGVGGFALDRFERAEGSEVRGERVGTAYGLDHLVQLMRTVGVDSWEKLPGEQVIVLFDGDGMIGSRAVGIASVLDETRVLILSEHAEAWQAREVRA